MNIFHKEEMRCIQIKCRSMNYYLWPLGTTWIDERITFLCSINVLFMQTRNKEEYYSYLIPALIMNIKNIATLYLNIWLYISLYFWSKLQRINWNFLQKNTQLNMIKSKYFKINSSRFDKGINLSLLSSCEVLGASWGNRLILINVFSKWK